ncbi:hypothetical protein POM88_023744 [Heracleum sosnowskyi]|uniref:C3H1-type domain-containing protein n=1 Tax=Heracleum sosnowskyi TaxID=360622 RepID=A0AAD8IJA9_9APIA|nr:hypothetical protein POM88_023744 [Heracleum sosnowskyi]
MYLVNKAQSFFISSPIERLERISMERIYIDNNSKLHKVMALRGGISPISNSPVRAYNHPPRSPGFDLRANSNVLSNLENLESPIVRYYRSGGLPLSSIENLEISPKTMFKTPVKVEEDVIVMDGVLVGPVTASRVRSSSSTSDSGGSSSSGGKGFYKTESCRSWEDFGSCRYGTKCQFAHGKEELRPTRFSNKSKSEAQMCKSYSSGSGSYGSKSRLSYEQINLPASGTDFPFTTASLRSQTVSQNNSPASATDSPVSVISSRTQTVLPIKLEKAMNCAGNGPSTPQTVSQNNSPASAKDSPVFAIPSKPQIVLPIKLVKALNCAGKSFPTVQTVSQHNSPASATYSPVSMIPSRIRIGSPIKLEKAMNCAGKSSSTTQTVSPSKLQNATNRSESFTSASSDWSPLDDGIEVALPCSSSADKAQSREEVDAYINSVLYGSSKRKTFPVFAAICPR